MFPVVAVTDSTPEGSKTSEARSTDVPCKLMRTPKPGVTTAAPTRLKTRSPTAVMS